jgi:hypothetical protein
MWTLENLMECASSTQAEINGRWVPARPLSGYGLYGLWLRMCAAWAVLRGKADAFTWPEGQ